VKKQGLSLILVGLIFFAGYSWFKGNVVMGIVCLVGVVLISLIVRGMSDKGNASNTPTPEVEGKTASVYGFVAKEDQPDFEEAKRVRGEMLKNMKPDEVSAEINKASGLMLNKDFEGSIRAYEAIMLHHPERKGTCLGQIGAAEFFLGHYEKALASYIESMEHGEDSSMTEDNIWEVCEVLYNKDSSKEWIEQYVSLYPEGRYVKKANKLVS
jgi:tetratricopeptide (TPR) repeat protein